MGVSDLIWRDRPLLRDPVMVCAFKGWNDAGEAASAALGFIRGHFESAEVASIDPEEFYDFTAVRPNVRLAEGFTREIDWPENTVSTAEVPGAEGDLLEFYAGASTGRSSTTRRCCRAIAGRARSTGRSSRATRRPASRSSGPTRASTPARC